MNCLKIKPLLPSIAERDTAPRLTLEAAKHLAGCTACAEDLLRLRALTGMLDRLPTVDIPRSFAQRVARAARRRTTIAFLILALVLLGGAGLRVGAEGRLGEAFQSPLSTAAFAANAAFEIALEIISVARASDALTLVLQGTRWGLTVAAGDSFLLAAAQGAVLLTSISAAVAIMTVLIAGVMQRSTAAPRS